jgi:hypothetical protein
MDYLSSRSNSSDEALDQEDTIRFSHKESREKRDTLEMLGPDYLDFAKADIAVIKDNRFTVNLAREQKQ